MSKSSLSLWLQNMPLPEKRLRELRDWNATRIERFQWRLIISVGSLPGRTVYDSIGIRTRSSVGRAVVLYTTGPRFESWRVHRYSIFFAFLETGGLHQCFSRFSHRLIQSLRKMRYSLKQLYGISKIWRYQRKRTEYVQLRLEMKVMNDFWYATILRIICPHQQAFRNSGKFFSLF